MCCISKLSGMGCLSTCQLVCKSMHHLFCDKDFWDLFALAIPLCNAGRVLENPWELVSGDPENLYTFLARMAELIVYLVRCCKSCVTVLTFSQAFFFGQLSSHYPIPRKFSPNKPTITFPLDVDYFPDFPLTSSPQIAVFAVTTQGVLV